MQNRMIETPGGKIRENFLKLKPPSPWGEAFETGRCTGAGGLYVGCLCRPIVCALKSRPGHFRI